MMERMLKGIMGLIKTAIITFGSLIGIGILVIGVLIGMIL